MKCLSSQPRMATSSARVNARQLSKVPQATRRVGRLTAVRPVAAIGVENYIDQVPDSLLRVGIDDLPTSIKARFERIIREGQDSIVKAIEEVDGKKFHQDAWVRAEGGGGITRVLDRGNVWEKAGVNVSVVYGTMPAEAYRAATGTANNIDLKGGRVPFFAAGISSVMHPWNPHCPTMHFNYRYFETETWNGIPGQWWFGGGTDITPSYLDVDDMKHFHGTYKRVCDKHDPTYYPRFKKWCDEYFMIKHRGETRGLGGIFFDDLNDKAPDQILAFSTECLSNVVESYVPIVKKHMNDKFTEEEKNWQQLRRGRYVEYNLVYDRGTTFGLKTGGRIESILMSLPLTTRFEYCNVPKPGSREAEIMERFKNPEQNNWV